MTKVNKQRLTKWYTVDVQDGIAVLHHTPRFILYYANLAMFERERKKAYRVLARQSRSDIHIVRGYSMTIDYAKDGFAIQIEQASWNRDVRPLLTIWTTNIRNWHKKRVSKVMHLAVANRVCIGEMTWEDFQCTFQ